MVSQIPPGERKGGGQVGITHHMLASIIQQFRVIILPRSGKRWWFVLLSLDILFSFI